MLIRRSARASGRARAELEQLKTQTATAANEKVALFDLLVGLLLDDNHFQQLVGKYPHLRRFAPALLAALRFSGVPAARPLLDAIELLRELNADGRRVLPATAPTGFVPARWRAHVIVADGGFERPSGSCACSRSCAPRCAPARSGSTGRDATSPPTAT